MSTSSTSVGVTLAFFAVAALGKGIYTYGTGDNVDLTVKRLERIVTGSGENVSSKYLVFTEEGDVYENTDSWFRLKFNSSTVQGQFDEGESYNCDTYGWRVPFFSMYPNIIACTANDDGKVSLFTTDPLPKQRLG